MDLTKQNVTDPTAELAIPHKGVEALQETESTRWDAIKAGYIEGNSFASQFAYQDDPVEASLLAQERKDYLDGNYDWREYMPPELEAHSLQYAQTTSPRDAQRLTEQIDKSMDYYRDMSGHPVLSFFAMMGGGMTDLYQLPLFMLPAGAALKTGVKSRLGLAATEYATVAEAEEAAVAAAKGVRTGLATTMVRGAKYGAAGGAIADLTHKSPTRGGDTMLTTMTASAMFGALLSAGGKYVGEMNEALNQVDIDMRTIDSHAVLSELSEIPKYDSEVAPEVVKIATEKVDAWIKEGKLDPAERDAHIEDAIASTQQTAGELKYPKFYRTAAAFSPQIRLMTSPSHAVRSLVAALTSSPLQRKSMKVDPSIDLLMRIQTQSSERKIIKSVNTRFKEYTATAGKGRMTPNEFRTEVTLAMADGDVHDNPFVEAAAKDIRKVADVIRDRKAKAGLDPHGYDGFYDLEVDDILELNLEEKDLVKILRTKPGISETERTQLEQALSDELLQPKYKRALRRLKLKHKKLEPDVNAALDELDAKHFPDGSENATPEQMKAYQEDYDTLAGRLEEEADVNNAALEYAIDDLTEKYFGDSGSAVRNHYNEELERLPTTEEQVVIDHDSLAEMPQEVLQQLEDRGLISRHAIDTPSGVMPQVFNARVIEGDPNGFTADITRLLEEEFATVKGKVDYDARIAEAEEAIQSLEQDLEAKMAKDEFGSENELVMSQKQIDLEQEIDLLRNDPTAEKMVIKLEKELEALKSQDFAIDNQLEIKRRELERLQKAKEEEWADIVDQIPGVVRDFKNRVLHQDYKQGFKVLNLDSVVLGNRVVNIPHSKITKWLNTDVQNVWTHYMQHSIPELLMAERFGGKSGFTRVMRETLDHYDELIQNASSPKEAAKLSRQKGKDRKDLEALNDMIHRRYGLSKNPDGILHKGTQYMRWYNMLTSLGMMTFSAIPDLGNIIARQGANAFRFHKYMWNSEGKPMREWLNDIGVMADVHNAQSIERFTIGDNSFSATHKTDMMARNAVRVFNKWTGMNHWNAYLKRFVAGVYAMGIVRDAHLLKAGRLSAKNLSRYNTSFLTREHLLAIAEVSEPGKPLDISSWPEALQQRLSSAVFNEADTVIVTPTLGELPLAAHSDLGKIIFQFKSFAMSSNHKLFLSSVDDMTAQKAIGLMSMLFFADVSQHAKAVLKGKELPSDPDQRWKNAIAASGIWALSVETNAIIERLTSGQLSMWRAMGLDNGEAVTYNAQQSALDFAFGPSAGFFNNAKHVFTAIATGEPRASDIRSGRHLMGLNNHWALYRLFSNVEQQAIERYAK